MNLNKEKEIKMRNKLLDYNALRIGNKYMGFVITGIDMIKRLYEIEKYILDNIKPEYQDIYLEASLFPFQMEYLNK